ncbi:hypothetical protein Aduo_019798 [Ancylostoma duodenale]
MLRLFLAFAVPTLTYAAVQCYVGQKLFSYESNNAICARFIPYHCAAQCEWRRNCSTHSSFAAFHGRRTFVSGLLINSKSLMVLCCASLATRLETDDSGRERCIWRDTESIAVLGPSIRTNPVLAPNHYIRDVKMERDGVSRIDVTLEVCQYQTEREHCIEDKMTEIERKRFSIIQQKLQHTEAAKIILQNQALKSTNEDKKAGDCENLSQSDCGKEIQSIIQGCCKDQPNCDHDCMVSVEKTLMDATTHNKWKGCKKDEVRLGLECFGHKTNNHIS